MSNVNHSIAHRLLAVILALVMVVGMLPTAAIQAEAAENQWITVTVKDGEGNPVEGAAVQTVLTESDGTTPVYSGTLNTNAEGVADVYAYSVDGWLLSATVTAEGFEDATLAASAVASDKLNFEVTMTASQPDPEPELPKIEDVTIVPKANLVFDGSAQDLVSVTEVEGDVITYKVDGGEVSDKAQGTDAKTYSVEVTVTRTGYQDLVVPVTVTIAPAKITGISIENKVLAYNEESREIVTFTGSFEENDVVTWIVNTENTGSKDIPSAIAVGSYTVTLTVERANHEKFTQTVVSYINDQIDLEGLKVTGLEGKYAVDDDGNAEEQEAVKVENKGDYTLYYQLDNGSQSADPSAWTTTIPTASQAGKYIVWVKVVKEGYNDTNVPVDADAALAPYNVYIAKAEVEAPAKDTTVFTYNTEAQTYTVAASDLYTVAGNVQTNAGTHKVTISLNDPSNYQWVDGDSEALKYDFVINKAPQEIEFASDAMEDASISGQKEFLLSECFPVVIVKGGSNNTVEYSVVSSDPAGIATIDEGKLIVTDAGDIVIQATLAGDDANYADAEPVTHNFVVRVYGADGHKLIWYDAETPYTYTVGTQNGMNIGLTPNFASDNVKRHTIYEATPSVAGLAFDEDTGKFNITDYEKLAEAMIAGTNTITVTAKIRDNDNRYDPYEASYKLNLAFAPADSNAYEVDTPAGEIPAFAGNSEIQTGWHVDDKGVKVSAKAGYSVSLKATPSETAENSILLDEQGTAAKYFYVTEVATGAVARVALTDVKYDSVEPSDVTVAFDPAPNDSPVKDHYFPTTDIEVVFTAVDATSGVKYFDWVYYKDECSTSTLPDLSGRLEAEPVEDEEGKYTARLQISLDKEQAEQYHGNFVVTAIDAAGNDADNDTTTDESGRIIVVDTIDPKVMITYTWSDKEKQENEVYEAVPEEQGTHRYYNDSVVFTIKITEANFFLDKDMKPLPGQINIQVNGEDWAVWEEREDWDAVTWTRDGNSDVYYGTFVIPDDGDYVVTIEYTDYSGKGMVGENIEGGTLTGATYTSDLITIDTKDPVIGEYEFNEKRQQSVGITITEHNFMASKITLSVEAKDITGATVESVDFAKILAYLQNQGNWENTEDTDEWKLKLASPELIDAIYDISIGYDGFADDDAAPKATGVFTVDHTAPDASKITIEYSEPTFLDKVLNTITLGFYNPDVTITFTAYDITSGIKQFNWSYVRSDGVSKTTNADNFDGVINADPQDAEFKVEGDKAVAIITLPREEAQQLRGHIVVNVIDNCGNGGAENSSATNNNIVIVDTIAPEISVGYNDPSNTVGDKAYYNGNVAVEITVKEANFFAEDVVVKVSKNGGEATAVSPTWSEGTIDVHTGNFTLAGDGHYIVSIDYTDRSKNHDEQKSSYTSHEITIDETAPVINVAYNNNNVANEKYFNATRTATITITEHNFDQQLVKFTQNAARGGVVPTVSWSSNGDTHTATFNYTTDGDYTFDVTMTDLATNASAAANYGNSAAGKDFVIDTTFEDMISQSGVENGVAYGHDAEVIPNIKISDINLDEYTVTLTGVQKDTTIDLTDDVNALLKKNTETVTGIFDIFETVQNLDGIYTLKMTSKDKAGNEDSMEIVFTVNRFGSVYVYDEYLLGLVQDGGAYVQSIDGDLVITEYNADKLVADSLKIEITVDGKPLENVEYTVTPELNDTVSVGSSGWYQYKYTISKDNFAADGVYKISVSSKDATGNTPENSNYEDMGMNFRVDSTKSEISSVVGLEEAIINAQEVTVKYTVFDTIGIKSIMVYVNGQVVSEITDFAADPNNYSGSFTLAESSSAQAVRIVVEDMAGNITDTNAEDFAPAYEFNGSVTVSTNIFVRWYANKPLFWGSIGGVVVLAAAVCFIVAAKKKKKEEGK